MSESVTALPLNDGCGSSPAVISVPIGKSHGDVSRRARCTAEEVLQNGLVERLTRGVARLDGAGRGGGAGVQVAKGIVAHQLEGEDSQRDSQQHHRDRQGGHRGA